MKRFRLFARVMSTKGDTHTTALYSACVCHDRVMGYTVRWGGVGFSELEDVMM